MQPDEHSPAHPTLPSEDRVERILARAGLEARAMQLLAQGSPSVAWPVETSQACLVLRIGTPHPGKWRVSRTDAEVRERLAALDPRVAEPIAASGSFPGARGGDRECDWSIDRFVPGLTAPRGAIPVATCRDVGELHYASRAATLGRPHRLRAALAFLQAQLPPAEPLSFLDRLE